MRGQAVPAPERRPLTAVPGRAFAKVRQRSVFRDERLDGGLEQVQAGGQGVVLGL